MEDDPSRYNTGWKGILGDRVLKPGHGIVLAFLAEAAMVIGLGALALSIYGALLMAVWFMQMGL
jgi:hypothetical protein